MGKDFTEWLREEGDTLQPARSASPALATSSVVDVTVGQLPVIQARSRSNRGSGMEEMPKQEVSQRGKTDGFGQREDKRTLKHQRNLKVSCLQDDKWMMIVCEGEDSWRIDVNTPNFIL